MRAAFVTNICAHYRIKTFELLARLYDMDYFFYSASDEWYWQRQHGVRSGDFNHKYMKGFRIGHTRIAPSLITELLSVDYDIYLKCINGRFALPVTYLISRIRRKPFILWTGIWMRLQTPAHKLFFPVTRFLYRHSDAIVTYGEHVKRYLIEEGVPAEKIFSTKWAVDNDNYNRPVTEDEQRRLRDRLDIAPHQKVVLYLGRLEQSKGLPYLLEAISKIDHDDAVLLIVGTGSEEKRLRRMANEKGMEGRTRFAGYVETEKTLPYYSIAWVYVLPSITTNYFKEAWGLVVNEAMNQGVPVIATDAVGAAAGGLIRDGINGYIVPERDSPALAARIEQLLQDPGLRRRMGQNAKECMKTWGNEEMVQGFARAIDYVLDRNKSTQEAILSPAVY